jgi:predicted outer membrane repeat protein
VNVRPLLLATFLLLALLLTTRSGYAADAVVGTGNPASCTETALDAALTTAGNGGGVITFNCGPAVATITLSTFKVVNLGNVTIDGDGRIILDANRADRHFFAGPITFRLQNLTLRRGDSLVSGGAIEASGARVFLENVQFLDNRAAVAGGAIYCYNGDLTISNSRFTGNTAPTAGAIYNDGCAVEIQNTAFQDNEATGAIGRGGAIENAVLGVLTVRSTRFNGNQALDGGGVYNAGGATALLTAATLRGNSGGYGGGVENSGTLTLTDSLLDGNTVTGSGGGLWNISGTAFVQRTTFAGNTAAEGGGVNTYGSSLVMEDVNLTGNVASNTHGGGLYHSGGVAFITNATISGNRASAPGGNGGGVYQSADDNLTLTNVTLANNQAGLFGGGLYHYGRYAILTNVTLGNNTAGAAGNAIYEDAPLTPGSPGLVQIANSVIFGAAVNCDGALFQSLGHNISKGSCAALSDATDQENIAGDLLLGALGDNGGVFPMQTFLPQAGSPLIDAAGAGQCPAQDQRSAGRVGVCDIGAVESGAAAYRLHLPLVEN